MSTPAGIARLRQEYRSSLKAIAAEELVDLLMFRPLAFIAARLFQSTPLRPIHVTLLSMVLGVGGGILLGMTPELDLLPAALFIWLSALLDCADGQLARLQKSASPMGRILDGLIDYAVGISIFVGIGVRGNPAVSESAWWCAVGGAGASYALQAMVYDLFRTEYLKIAGTGRSTREVQAIPGAAPMRNGSGVVHWMYARYAACQQVLGTWLGGIEDDERTSRHLRIWGLNGTSTHVVFLIVACLAARVDLYLIYLIVMGNAFMLIMILMWQKNLKKPSGRPESSDEVHGRDSSKTEQTAVIEV